MPRKVVASTYVTLDGYVDEPGRWSFPFWSEEASQFTARELFASDALLLGRITYEGFAAAWPTMEGTGSFGEPALRSHVPLIVTRGGTDRVLGVLALAHDRPIDASSRPLVQASADLAAVALDLHRQE